VPNAEPQPDLLDPQAFLKIAPLEIGLDACRGRLSLGHHRSPYKGGCVEFAEHRPYSAGDEIRMLDWRAFARSDRYYIKRYEEETNLQAVLVLDASGSMAFGQSTMSKLRYAQVACACLARLMLQQRDAVGLAVVDTRLRAFVPPRCNPGHLAVLWTRLSQARPGGETSLAAIPSRPDQADQAARLVLLASDCFDDVERWCARSIICVLTAMSCCCCTPWPEELSFSFSRWSRFESLEKPNEWLDLDRRPSGGCTSNVWAFPRSTEDRLWRSVLRLHAVEHRPAGRRCPGVLPGRRAARMK